jgi:alcohol dehydrogenase class IV
LLTTPSTQPLSINTDYTKGLSREAIGLLFKYLPRAFKNGNNDYLAREKVHYAATIAGKMDPIVNKEHACCFSR